MAALFGLIGAQTKASNSFSMRLRTGRIISSHSMSNIAPSGKIHAGAP